MVVSLAFVNGSHYWPVIKWFPPCLSSTPFIHMVRIRTFFGRFGLKTLGLTVASSFCYFPSCARPCYTLYDILLRHRSTLYFLWLWSIVEYGSTLFICGHDSFRFDMAPFCILSDHDSFISYTYVGSTYIFMEMFCIWMCMSQRSVFLTFISLSCTFTRALLILDSLLSLHT